jgi:hypothetical protein
MPCTFSSGNKDQKTLYAALSYRIKRKHSPLSDRLEASDGNGEGLEGTLAAIAALACHAHLNRHMPSWKLHIAAIGRVIRLKRQLLRYLNPRLVALVQWYISLPLSCLFTADIYRVESIGSYALDTSPSSNTSRPDVSQTTDHDSPINEPVVPYIYDTNVSTPLLDAFKALQTMNARLSLLYSTLEERTWHNPAGIDQLVEPVTRQFLSTLCRLDPPGSIGPCVRSGAILYLTYMSLTLPLWLS